MASQRLNGAPLYKNTMTTAMTTTVALAATVAVMLGRGCRGAGERWRTATPPLVTMDTIAVVSTHIATGPPLLTGGVTPGTAVCIASSTP